MGGVRVRPHRGLKSGAAPLHRRRRLGQARRRSRDSAARLHALHHVRRARAGERGAHARGGGSVLRAAGHAHRIPPGRKWQAHRHQARAVGMHRLPARRDPRLCEREPGAGLLSGHARQAAAGDDGLRRRQAVPAPRRTSPGEVMRRVFAAFALVVFGQGVSAQSFPSKPIRLIAPFAAGGALDLIARGVGAKLSESTGQPVVVENRAGASGAIGSEFVAKSAPDGYTLLLGATTTHGINPAFNPKSLPYDAVKDFTAVSLVATIPHALIVNARLPVSSVQDLVRLGKTRSLNYGSAGNGSPHHLAAELFKSLTGIEAVHVPYKGSGPALADLMAGNLDFISVEYTAAEPHVKSGKLKALALATRERVA